MSEHISITNGRLVRSGFYRAPQDASAKAYAEKVRTGVLDTSCVFCPESIERRHNDEDDKLRIIDEIGHRAWAFYVIQAEPAYAHFDAQRVVDHKLILPHRHIERDSDLQQRALDVRNRYIHAAEDAAGEGLAVQSYTRSDRNPSKSVGHLHTHLLTLSLAPLARFAYDIENGVTIADFIEPTPEQIQEVEHTRRDAGSR